MALLAAGVVLAGLVLLGPRLLLGWYVYEVRRLDIPEEPADAIITYPLA